MENADEQKIKNVEKFADFLISTCPDEITCEKQKKYQSHNHTFTCAKKRKIITIKENEGHGRFDGKVNGPALSDISVCRFGFPKFPLDETKLIRGMSKDADEKLIKERKEDLNKIVKFLTQN